MDLSLNIMTDILEVLIKVEISMQLKKYWYFYIKTCKVGEDSFEGLNYSVPLKIIES